MGRKIAEHDLYEINGYENVLLDVLIKNPQAFCHMGDDYYLDVENATGIHEEMGYVEIFGDREKRIKTKESLEKKAEGKFKLINQSD